MPIISGEKEVGFARNLPKSTEQIQKTGPAFGDVVQAAFENENTFVNFAANGFELNSTYPAQEGYNPFDSDIKGFELYSDSFIESKSADESSAIKDRISHEIRNQEILRDGGAVGVVSQIAAGAFDPIYWPAMALGIGGAKAAATTGQAFARSFGAGAISEIPAEIVKQELQETRTLEESALNIGGSAILSGLLGAGIHKFIGDNPDIGIDVAKVESDLQNYVNGGPTELSMGAAQVKVLSKEDLDLVGLGGLEKIPVSPLVRTQTSPEVKTQQVASMMMETPLVSKGNVKGIATAPEGGTVETRAKRWDFNLYEGIRGLRENYSSYKKANKGGDILSYRDFRIQVGKAAIRNDEHAIPEVAAASKSMRHNTLNPMKDAAIEQKLLPEGVEVTTAASYFTRIYNFDKITADLPEWNSIVEGWLRRAEPKLSPIEVTVVRKEITDNITGTSSGRTSYDVVVAERGPMKERVFNIPDQLIEDFLEQDAEMVLRQYVKTMAPDIELTRAFGSTTLESEIKEISDGYNIKLDAATSEKARKKLKKQETSDITDISAMRDRIRGTYKVPSDPNNWAVRVGRLTRDFNFMRMLGGMTISALPDAARLAAVNGLKPVAKGLAQLASSPSRFKMARAEVKKAAVGLDMVLNSRASSLAELVDANQRGSAFERGVRAASDTFSKLTLMSQWNSVMKQFAGVITADRIISESAKWAAGTISKANIKRMAASGIDEDLAKRISGQFDEHGSDGVLKLAQGDKWTDPGALDTFRSALLKDVDRTILTPGLGEKALWTSSETGKMIFQFKTFASVAHHKVLLADLQYGDASALNGFLLSVALGGVAYGMKQTLAGKEISKNPSQIIVESMDKSGTMGYFWDVNNISAKMTNGELSVNKLFGADPVSRYASRNVIGAMMGPTVGTIEDVRQITGSIATGEFSERDVHKIRKMLPGQNLFYMRQLLDKLEEGVAK